VTVPSVTDTPMCGIRTSSLAVAAITLPGCLGRVLRWPMLRGASAPLDRCGVRRLVGTTSESGSMLACEGVRRARECRVLGR
jgi:hypothetical protein